MITGNEKETFCWFGFAGDTGMISSLSSSSSSWMVAVNGVLFEILRYIRIGTIS